MHRVLAALLLSSAVAGLAVAQPVLQPVPSEALQCLVPTDALRGAPAYPFEPFRKGEPGRVKVELRFTAPDKPPRARVLEQEGGVVFAEAVLDWVKTLRAPCVSQGEAVLVQDYQFKPFEEKVNFGPPREGDADRRAALLACLRQPPTAVPSYPQSLQDAGLQGRVYGEFTFTAPDQPPRVELLHMPGARPFAAPIRKWSQGYRMPCFEADRDQPFTLRATFIYKFQDSEYGFKPLTLLDFMSRVKGIREQTLQLDTTTMGCPFDVRLQYLMPDRRNAVGVRGDYRTEREPLLRWLRTAELAVSTEDLHRVFADQADIAVPCIRIDLKPKEKTP